MFQRANYIILFIIFQLAINGVDAQLPVIKTHIDTNRITIGDQVDLTLTIEKNKNQVVRFPQFSDNISDGVEVVGEPRIDSVKIDKNSNRLICELKLTAFDTGIYYIPPQPVMVPLSGFTDTLFSEATYLEVFGVAIDTTGTIRDIKPNKKAPVTFREIMIYLIPVILLALIAALLVYYLKKKKKEEPEEKIVKITEPAHITALRELDKIKARKLWQQNKLKEYYTGITHVIRWYISQKFGIPALEQTSDEILDHVRKEDVAKINYDILEGLLNLADLVKFAKGEPDPDENIKHMDNAVDFIKKTKDVGLSESDEVNNEDKTE